MATTVEQTSNAEPPTPAVSPSAGELVARHRLATRLWHWTNVIAFFVMLMSGLMIFNAHPRLYWGQYGANFDTPWLEVGSRGDHGFARIGGFEIGTTGWLGVWPDARGAIQHRAFPHWITIPSNYSLADARIWHLAFAWLFAIGLIVYLVVSLINRHVQRDLAISGHEIAPNHLWQDIKDHAHLRFPTGEAALRYNILQKLSYAAVLFLLLPLMVLTGLTMSPGVDAGWPLLVDLFGGRQSARSIHFLVTWALVAFVLVHVAMVVLAGPYNEVRAMITGRYRLPRERGRDADLPSD